MSMNRTARLGFAAALFALLLGPLAFSAQSALAQGPTQSTYYGGGQEAGATISAYIGGELCDSTEVNDAGEWVLRIDEGDCNGNAEDGAEITFDVNDDHAEPHLAFTPGDAQQVDLEVIEDEHDDGMEDPDDGMDDGMGEGENGMKTPDPSDVGNAGFATGSGSTSAALVLALGALALAGVAGARTVTGRVD